MVQFIDDYKDNYGIELICKVLQIAPSTYHRAKDLSDNPHKHSLRRQHDDDYISEIKHIWQDSKCRYGARKVWQQMKADGLKVARCTVERLILFGDRGYISKTLSEWLTQNSNTTLITKQRRNMKEQVLDPMDEALLNHRSLIETVFDGLKNMCQIEYSRHRSVTGFITNMLSGLIAYCRFPHKPTLKNVSDFEGAYKI